jgi:acetolactate synthase-1/2/3 large subunit
MSLAADSAPTGVSKTQNSAQAIVETLMANGVDTVFGIPGAQAYLLFDALKQHQNSVRTIHGRHEQGVGYMAYGYAKASGREGVFAVVPGPGVLNASAAISTAYGASAPVLCLTGQVPSNFLGSGRGHLHELPDQLGILERLTKFAARINHPSEAPGLVDEAFRQMRSGRARPTAIEMPWDVFGATGPVTPSNGAAGVSHPEPDAKSLDEAADLIRQADNPMIMVGGGAIDAGAEILELAKTLQAPVVAHRGGRGIVSEENTYGFSCGEGYRLWDKTDLVIGIGTRMELIWSRWMRVPRSVKQVRIDLDPLEFVRLTPDVGILADSAVATRELSARLETSNRESREEEFAGVKREARAEFAKVQPHMSYLTAIREVLPPEGFFVEEICQAGFTARFGFPVHKPRTYVPAGYQDNLGFGFQTALGVKVAQPDLPVVAITGDGGFMFGIQELATAKQHGINLVTVVFNNNAWGNVRRDQINHFGGQPFCSELDNPDFVALAESFGVVAQRVGSAEALRPALSDAFDANAPVLIEVPCAPDDEATPWPFYMPGM